MTEFNILSISELFKLMLAHEKAGHYFGIPEEVFFKPTPNDAFVMNRYGQKLDTPVGVAAGPHTQLTQNIIASWLTGSRYIELKTVQVLDDLTISHPCIDMQDAGYNCEWSQELKIEDSYDQYLNAWIIIHILKDKFGWSETERGFIFNMSVGYNLEGIMSDKVQWFFNIMKNCSVEKEAKIKELAPLYPRIALLNIPDCISDNVTLSTMHGCPPDEIEKIAAYLISEKKLHTTVKFNPTILGAEKLRNILNKKLGWTTQVPDEAFGHDLKYNDAIPIIKNLTKLAEENNVDFSLKLTNTLESLNIRNVFPEHEKMNYMSGRALHPISINVAAMLQKEFNGSLDISFAGGADAFNIHEIISCGLKPVTVSSDVLRPGGYGRISQYMENLSSEFAKFNATSIDDYIIAKSDNKQQSVKEAALKNLLEYAKNVVESDNYRYEAAISPNIKSKRKLGWFDCIAAPCVHGCPTNQDIPDYLYYASKGLYSEALEVILKKNPFPAVLGMVCTHLCQAKCTRINYDDSLLIRDIKRFVMESSTVEPKLNPAPANGLKVAVIGAGPSGLSAAFFLVLEGFEVNVFESQNIGGGMVSEAIPAFRLKAEALQKDIDRIASLGVRFHWNHKIDSSEFENLRKTHNYIYLAVGAQKVRKLDIPGEDLEGVLNPLAFLASVKRGEKVNVGPKVAVIGGGNTAMDVARTAKRLVGSNGEVVVLYRRTRSEMPAGHEEVTELAIEGIKVEELVAPERINGENGKVKEIVFSRMKLEGLDNQGRPKPVKIDGSEVTMAFDTIIPAAGQIVDIDFVDTSLLKYDAATNKTSIPNVFIGGDAKRGASTVVYAVGDGRKVAENIIFSAKLTGHFKHQPVLKHRSEKEHLLMRSRRIKGVHPEDLTTDERTGFGQVLKPLTTAQASEESARCLFCDEYCNICVTVCPNRANFSYKVEPQEYKLEKLIRNEAGELIAVEDSNFVVKQGFQVVNIGDFCNECGNCKTFCPTEGAPWHDKPRVFLNINSFKKGKEGFFMNKIGDNKLVMIYKHEDEIRTLTKENDKYVYETSHLEVVLTGENFRVESCKSKVPCVNQVFLTFAAEMKIIMDNISCLYPDTLN